MLSGSAWETILCIFSLSCRGTTILLFESLAQSQCKFSICCFNCRSNFNYWNGRKNTQQMQSTYLQCTIKYSQPNCKSAWLALMAVRENSVATTSSPGSFVKCMLFYLVCWLMQKFHDCWMSGKIEIIVISSYCALLII